MREDKGVDFRDLPAPRQPYFDPELNAWILTQYQDVAAALRNPHLVPVTARSQMASAPLDAAAHARFRAEALRVLAPARLAEWETEFAALANRMAASLPLGQPIDLIRQYAQPWSLAVAGMAANVPAGELQRLSDLARPVFDAAGEPFDPELDLASRQATGELVRFFHGAPPLHLQMFIALAHSLPAFLGNAWLALLEHPAAIARLRQDRTLLPQAIDELLRLAGPARAQFRRAVEAVTIAGCEMAPQQRVILRLDLANRDPEQFADPDEFRFDRRSGSHLAFGGGLHACVAGTLIQSASAAATAALLDRGIFVGERDAVPAACFGVRYLKSLTTSLAGE